MKSRLFLLLLSFLLGYHHLYSQCDFVTPPAIKRVEASARTVTFSNVTMNGEETTYLEVEKGATVKITTWLESKKNRDYCPDCIVQIYWGIRGHTSVCAKSFHGYQFNMKKSTHKFEAPLEDGFYYITMGSTLDYSCKNNVYRPRCSPENAFAVLKVGNPNPDQKISLDRVTKGANQFLKTSLIKSGCFGELDKVEWFLEGEKLAFENQKEIPLTEFGNYKVVWSNCLASTSASFSHTSSSKEVVPLTLDQGSEPSESSFTLNPDTTSPTDKKIVQLTVVKEPEQSESNDLIDRIENNDKFVLEHLIFDLGKANLKPEAKRELDKLAQIMRSKPSMRILLEGHTDRRGSARKNQVLSEKRVESAKEYLVEQGISTNSIETKGWGHEKPLIVTVDVEKGKVNRRVEVEILAR